MAAPGTVLIRAVAAQASVSIAQFGLPAIGPELQEEYGLGLAGLGAVLTASLLGSGLTLLPGGVVVDRYGSRLPLAIGTLVGVVGGALPGITNTMTVIMVLPFTFGMEPLQGLAANTSKDSARSGYDKFKTNADGSIDLYIGPKVPAGHESNWIQTLPGKGFYPMMRFYSPKEGLFDGTWKLPDIELVK